MARVFDVIEYPNEMKEEIVRRFPEDGAGDFRIGSQVIVRESQRAVRLSMYSLQVGIPSPPPTSPN